MAAPPKSDVVLRQTRFTVLLFSVFSAWSISGLEAGLVIDPNGGEVLFRGSPVDASGNVTGNLDDSIIRNRDLGFGSSFQYFGRELNAVDVSENGNLRALGDVSRQDFFNFNLPPAASRNESLMRIAPLWDDYLMFDHPSLGNAIIEKVVDGVYYSVTWQDVRLFNDTVAGTGFPLSGLSAQVALFASEQIIRGVTFQPNDIVFSYETDANGNFGINLDGVAGLASGDNRYAAAVGTSNGRLDSDSAKLLLPQPDREFMLFRPVTDSTGFVQYDVSIGSFAAVPEPSALAFTLAALLGCVGWRPSRSGRA